MIHNHAQVQALVGVGTATNTHNLLYVSTTSVWATYCTV